MWTLLFLGDLSYPTTGNVENVGAWQNMTNEMPYKSVKIYEVHKKERRIFKKDRRILYVIKKNGLL